VIHTIKETPPNAKGLIALSTNSDKVKQSTSIIRNKEGSSLHVKLSMQKGRGHLKGSVLVGHRLHGFSWLVVFVAFHSSISVVEPKYFFRLRLHRDANRIAAPGPENFTLFDLSNRIKIVTIYKYFFFGNHDFFFKISSSL